MKNAIGSADDKLTFSPPSWKGRWGTRTRSKTASTPYLDPTERTACYIVAGQSNACNCGGTGQIYSPSNPSKLDHIFVDDGGVYQCADPLLGTENGYAGEVGNLFFRMADQMINQGYKDRVILIPVGIGATSVKQWNDELYERIVIAHRRATNKNIPVNGILWQQGETDTGLGTSQSVYLDNMGQLIGKVTNLGVSAPWVIAKGSLYAGETSSAVRAAQAAIVNGTDILSGPDTDTLTGTNRNPDNTHFSVTGMNAAASLWSTSIKAAMP
ncbi:sialate O-acetylesterase [Brucella sp. HL-2]|nr:sialate O-acetylesterase [Brucella sp. HL-2]MCV9910032.1 sialate O-acetylesterase [Brucella sp. HL-2]